MFYENKLPARKHTIKRFVYNLFQENAALDTDDGLLKYQQTKISYNVRHADGSLRSGYGIKKLSMPLDTVDMQTESELVPVGNDIQAMWAFNWYDKSDDVVQYYLFYFNEQNKFIYDNLFWSRVFTFDITSQFTSTPIGMPYRLNGRDVMIFSTADKLLVQSSGGSQYLTDAPKMTSCCAHNNKLFAITTGACPSLIYSNNLDITEWKNDVVQHVELFDERGNLTKVVSFKDYLYIFREYGITKLSTYSTDGDFSVSHIYQSTAYIYPGSIASCGDKIFFMARDGIYCFNGTTVTKLKIDCFSLLAGCENKHCQAICFEGKYYLACRMNFNDGLAIGCEKSESGFINNALLIYDPIDETVSIMRGADIKQLLALTNPYKNKIAICFYKDHIGDIGELTTDGKLFDEPTNMFWQSPNTDFGCASLKKMDTLQIKTATDCEMTIESDKQIKVFSIKGKNKLQTIPLHIIGNSFTMSIRAVGSADLHITNCSVSVSIQS